MTWQRVYRLEADSDSCEPLTTRSVVAYDEPVEEDR
jgi:hypothetical protein